MIGTCRCLVQALLCAWLPVPVHLHDYYMMFTWLLHDVYIIIVSSLRSLLLHYLYDIIVHCYIDYYYVLLHITFTSLLHHHYIIITFHYYMCKPLLLHYYYILLRHYYTWQTFELAYAVSAKQIVFDRKACAAYLQCSFTDLTGLWLANIRCLLQPLSFTKRCCHLCFGSKVNFFWWAADFGQRL